MPPREPAWTRDVADTLCTCPACGGPLLGALAALTQDAAVALCGCQRRDDVEDARASAADYEREHSAARLG